MKIIITLSLLILLVIPVVFAPDGESEIIDYSSPDDVNSMEPQDLASAIEQGKIPDMSIVDDNKLADAISHNPSISTKLEDNDLARAVNQDLSLLDNPSVMSDIDSRAQSDTYILNDNPNIKKKWFADRGITDEGAELETYDGSIVKTKGSQATTFNVNDHPGARVTKEGKLILSDGAEIESAEVTKAEDGSINVNGGSLTIDDSKERGITVWPKRDGKYVVQNGDFVLNGKRFASSKETPKVEVSFSDNIPTIKGENIIVTTSAETQHGIRVVPRNQKLFGFNGEITYYDESYIKIGKDTSFDEYENDNRVLGFNVKKETDYFIENDISHIFEGEMGVTVVPRDKCEGSCIQRDIVGNLRIKAIDDNDIKFDIPIIEQDLFARGLIVVPAKKRMPDLVKNIKIDKIKDNSNVELNYHNELVVHFSDGPSTAKGDLSKLNEIYLEHNFKNERGLSVKQKYGNFKNLENRGLTVKPILGTFIGQNQQRVIQEAEAIKKVSENIDPENTIVISVGINDYTHESDALSDLSESPQVDVRNINSFFKGKGVTEENTYTMSNPNKQEFLSQLRQIASDNPDKKIVLYYSGHGFRDDALVKDGNIEYLKTDNEAQYFIAPSDAQVEIEDGRPVFNNVISPQEINSIIGNRDDKPIYIFNSCHSGGFVRALDGSVRVASADSAEIAREYRGQGGYFTNYLINNVYTTSAKIDESMKQSGWATTEITEGQQHPQLLVVNNGHFSEPVKLPTTSTITE